MNIKEIKRRISAELSCINLIGVLITAGICVILGAIFALCGVERQRYLCFYLPKCALPSFFMVLFWGIAFAIFGAALGVLLFSRRREFCGKKEYALLLFVCALMLSYAWIAIVYKAASLFLGILTVLVILCCLWALLSVLHRIFLLATLGIALYGVWMIYLLYYSFALFLLNG